MLSAHVYLPPLVLWKITVWADASISRNFCKGVCCSPVRFYHSCLVEARTLKKVEECSFLLENAALPHLLWLMDLSAGVTNYQRPRWLVHHCQLSPVAAASPVLQQDTQALWQEMGPEDWLQKENTRNCQHQHHSCCSSSVQSLSWTMRYYAEMTWLIHPPNRFRHGR